VIAVGGDIGEGGAVNQALWLRWAAMLVVSSWFGFGYAGVGGLCRVRVVEEQTGWGVPLVELRTTHQVSFFTDNNGVIALDLPELMGRETWFEVRADGYEVAADGFGYRGVRLTPANGGDLEVRVRRTGLAALVGRLTGAGLLAESQRFGEALEERESGVLGCDSVQCAEYGGRLFWVWGDTTLAHYPLGIFDATAATSEIPREGQLSPPLRLELNQFRNEQGGLRAVARMPGEGPTWLSGLVTLRDREGIERLGSMYTKIRPPMDAYEIGLCVWDPAARAFRQHRVVWRQDDAGPRPGLLPDGHAVRWIDKAGEEWVLFGNPFPMLRVRASFEAWEDVGQWEDLVPQGEVDGLEEGVKVVPHSGSIAWSAYRKRWVAVFTERFGKPSAFGEVWYAEAEGPQGPWGRAVKVLSHRNYTFYNPRLHPEFGKRDSRVLFFEGTYSQMFADRPEPTPRYDYNQLLYRLDLDEVQRGLGGAGDTD
jgi:hypothetical protein